MAVKVRLTRTGGKNDPCFRVIATDERSPRDGSFLEILGWYDPKREGVNFNLKQDRIDYWKGNGAQLSDTVKSLVKKAKKLDVGETVAVEPEEPVSPPEPEKAVAAEEPAEPPAPEGQEEPPPAAQQ